MADKLKDLVLRLSADSAQLRRELQLAEGKTQASAKRMAGAFSGMQASVSRLTGLVGGLAGGYAVLAGAGALKSAIESTLEFADSIDKASGKLALSAEDLQRWRFAADQSGVGANAFDNAVQKMVEGAADASRGTGEALQGFARLGVSVVDSGGKMRSTNAILTDTLIALRGVENATERSAIAIDIFGARVAGIVNLAAGFEELIAKADRLGIVLDTTTIKRAVEAKNELAALGTIAQVQLAPALVALVPLLVAIAEKMAAAATATGRLFARFQDISELGGIGVESRLDDAAKKRSELVQRYNLATKIRAGVRGEPGFQTVQQADILRELGAVDAEIRQLKARRAELQGAKPPEAAASAGKAVEAQTKRTPEEIAQEKAAREAERAAEAAQREAERAAKLRATTIEDARLEAEQLERLVAAREISEEAYRAEQVAIDAENVARRAGIDLTSEEGAELEDAILKRDALKDKLDQLGEATETVFDDMTAAADRWADSIGDAFADLVLDGEVSFQRLARSFARDFISKAVSGLVSSALGGLFSSAGGPFASLFGGGKAGGGAVRSGTPYLVGEKGPELFVPSVAGQIVPNRALVSGGPTAVAAGGVSVTVINNTSSEIRTSERQGPGDTRQIEIEVGNLVDGQFRRGRFDGAMRDRYGARALGRGGL